MKIPLTSDTKAFWEKVHVFAKRYPFWCLTQGALPRPEDIPHSRNLGRSPYGHWCRVPVLDVAVWGFETEEARDKFALVYQAERWSI